MFAKDLTTKSCKLLSNTRDFCKIVTEICDFMSKSYQFFTTICNVFVQMLQKVSWQKNSNFKLKCHICHCMNELYGYWKRKVSIMQNFSFHNKITFLLNFTQKKMIKVAVFVYFDMKKYTFLWKKCDIAKFIIHSNPLFIYFLLKSSVVFF